VQQQTSGLGLEIGECEGRELGAAQCAGEPEQENRGVADPALGSAVDGGDDPPDVGDAERSGRATRRAADDPARAAAHLPDDVVVDWVRDTVGAVLVPDGRASRVDGR